MLGPERGKGCAGDEVIVEDELERVLEEKSALRMRVQDGHSPTLTLFKKQVENLGTWCVLCGPQSITIQ